MEVLFLMLILGGVGLAASVLLVMLGLVLKLIMLPLTLGFWLLKGLVVLCGTVLVMLLLLPATGLVLSLLLLPLALPLLFLGWILHRVH